MKHVIQSARSFRQIFWSWSFFDLMMHHVASYCGLRVIDHCHFVAESWCFLVVFRCWTSRRKLASRPCFIVHDLHMTWSHFLKFLWSRVATSFQLSIDVFFFIIFLFPSLLCFPTGRGPCLEQIPTSELSDFDGLRKERVHDLSGSSVSLHGWASPSHRLRPGRLLVYEHLGGGDVFNRLQKCTCDNAGSSVYSLFEQHFERRFDISNWFWRAQLRCLGVHHRFGSVHSYYLHCLLQ